VASKGKLKILTPNRGIAVIINILNVGWRSLEYTKEGRQGKKILCFIHRRQYALEPSTE
jgi:ribulose 1,5-bisphosphate carboxylase large subunit-like protein